MEWYKDAIEMAEKVAAMTIGQVAWIVLGCAICWLCMHRKHKREVESLKAEHKREVAVVVLGLGRGLFVDSEITVRTRDGLLIPCTSDVVPILKKYGALEFDARELTEGLAFGDSGVRA